MGRVAAAILADAPRGPAARAPAGSGRIRQRGGLLHLAGVDQLLEPATDLLASGEEIVVTSPAGREMHDADALVARAVAACVRSRLVEGPEAVACTPQPRHVRTPTTPARRSEASTRRLPPQFADVLALLPGLSTAAAQRCPQDDGSGLA